MEAKKLHIEHVDIKKLKPATYNPRKWEQKAIDDLMESIRRFGLVDPIIVNGAPSRKNVVIGGHFRLKVAKDLGYKKIPVVYLNIPNTEEEKELNLRLNKNTGAWDYEILRDFDIGQLLDVGFDDSDLSAIWDDVLEIEDDYFDPQKELEKIKEVTVKEGDLYLLGSHRLICGDSTKQETIQKLLGDTKVEMIYSDPPYNININYADGIGGKGKYGGTFNQDSKSDSQYKDFLKLTLKNALSVTKKDAHFFYWCDENYIWLLQELYRESKIDHKRVCLWIKNNHNATPQIAFNKVYEPCVYGIRGRPYLSKTNQKYTEILNKEIDGGNRCLDDIFDHFNIWLAKRLPANEYQHPTEKPVTLHEKPLRRCTKPGDKVLDLFGGSGSTLIACEQLKRTCYMVELDPLFCTLIINRYEKLTGKKAEKIN